MNTNQGPRGPIKEVEVQKIGRGTYTMRDIDARRARYRAEKKQKTERSGERTLTELLNQTYELRRELEDLAPLKPYAYRYGPVDPLTQAITKVLRTCPVQKEEDMPDLAVLQRWVDQTQVFIQVVKAYLAEKKAADAKRQADEAAWSLIRRLFRGIAWAAEAALEREYKRRSLAPDAIVVQNIITHGFSGDQIIEITWEMVKLAQQLHEVELISGSELRTVIQMQERHRRHEAYLERLAEIGHEAAERWVVSRHRHRMEHYLRRDLRSGKPEYGRLYQRRRWQRHDDIY